jgi:hypothetical protein
MATGYDERYARRLHEQSLESEIIRGISQFPTDSIRNDPDAFFAWQLQNQEFEGRRENNSIPLSSLNSVSQPLHPRNERRKDKNQRRGGGGDEKNPLIIDSGDSDTECDGPSACQMNTDDVVRYSDNGRRPGIKMEETRPYHQHNGEDMVDGSYPSLTENGSLLAQPQSEEVNSSGHSTFTFYSDDVGEESMDEVSQYDEDVSAPNLIRFPSQPFPSRPKNMNGFPNHHHMNGYNKHNPPTMKGSRRGRQWPKRQNHHHESANTYIPNRDSEADNARITVDSDEETEVKQTMLDTPNHMPRRKEKNLRRAQKNSDTVNDELVARRLGRELNRSQVEKDGEMARRYCHYINTQVHRDQ